MRTAACLLCLTLLGCDAPVVDWTDPAVITQGAGASTLEVDSSGRARFVSYPGDMRGAPQMAGSCSSGVAIAPGAARLHAAWWRVRPDSSAALYVAASPDSGKTWEPPSAVDTTDVGSIGCRRPPPSLATVGDDVYVAYSMNAPEGTGVFFAHFMGSMLHSPVPVVYGERLVATAITADANRVAVAYEDPNGKRQEIDVALSASQGHLFEQHSAVSRDIDVASAPAVAFNGPMLAVSWLTRRGGDSTTTRIVRVGRMQP